MHYTTLDTPIGELLLAGTGDALCEIRFARDFPGDPRAVTPPRDWTEKAARLRPVTRQLREYFAGRRRTFDLELAPAGTPFQLEVWLALREIPFGETVSYGELARRIDRPGAARAVGAANGRNPIPIIVPCHRVIGSDGSLTGFGGGLATKQALLDLERTRTGAQQLF